MSFAIGFDLPLSAYTVIQMSLSRSLKPNGFHMFMTSLQNELLFQILVNTTAKSTACSVFP